MIYPRLVTLEAFGSIAAAIALVWMAGDLEARLPIEIAESSRTNGGIHFGLLGLAFLMIFSWVPSAMRLYEEGYTVPMADKLAGVVIGVLALPSLLLMIVPILEADFEGSIGWTVDSMIGLFPLAYILSILAFVGPGMLPRLFDQLDRAQHAANEWIISRIRRMRGKGSEESDDQTKEQ